MLDRMLALPPVYWIGLGAALVYLGVVIYNIWTQDGSRKD